MTCPINNDPGPVDTDSPVVTRDVPSDDVTFRNLVRVRGLSMYMYPVSRNVVKLVILYDPTICVKSGVDTVTIAEAVATGADIVNYVSLKGNIVSVPAL